MLWLIQPDKARELLGSAAMTESGLMPRFISFDSEAEAQELPEHRHAISAESRTDWEWLLGKLANEYRANGKNPRTVKPSTEAFKLFHEFDNETRRRRRKDGSEFDIAPFAARWAENAWRLALVIHAGNNAEFAHAEPLTERTATQSINLMRWFIMAQLRLLAAGRQEQRLMRLNTLRESLVNGRKSIRDLVNSNRFTKEEVEALVESTSSLEIIQINSGGRPSRVVQIKTT